MDEFSDSPPKRTAAVPTQNDDITFVERMASKSSFRRQEAVTALPPVVLDVEDRSLNDAFDREFLKVTLGKSLTDRSVSFLFSLHHSDFGLRSPGKPIITSSYLCPTLNHHPWCPSTPGEHGFIFVGLGKDKDSYHSVAIRNLFVGLPKTVTSNRRFRYLGKYKVTRVDPLSVDEWAMLSPEVSAVIS